MTPLQTLVAQAFLSACRAELEAPKPGNVHVFAAGHRMEARDFLDSAAAAAGPLVEGLTVGARIFGAIEATWAAVGQNTNLGIVLLCAPLAQAVLTGEGGDLQVRLARVLAQLTVADADLAFRAIARARPAGLGSAGAHDVHAPATITLLGAMQAAADRDRVAFQYASNFEDIFMRGQAVLDAARGLDPRLATLRLYAQILGAIPDSHIARKFGDATAQAVRTEAEAFARALDPLQNVDAAFALALDFDASLKRRGLNPGSSADLTVATLFADCLGRILANAHKNG